MRVTITVSTEDYGDIEVEERSLTMRMGQNRAATIDGLLTRASAKVRAAYGITPTEGASA